MRYHKRVWLATLRWDDVSIYPDWTTDPIPDKLSTTWVAFWKFALKHRHKGRNLLLIYTAQDYQQDREWETMGFYIMLRTVHYTVTGIGNHCFLLCPSRPLSISPEPLCTHHSKDASTFCLFLVLKLPVCFVLLFSSKSLMSIVKS